MRPTAAVPTAWPIWSAVVLSLGVARAQGTVAPFQIAQVNPLPGLAPGTIAVGAVRSASFVHFANDPPWRFYGALAVTALPPALGGLGGADSDLVCGYYDAVQDVFTPNGEAAALNSSGNEILMSVAPDGLTAVFDRINAWAWLARRTSLAQPWQLVGVIGNVPPGLMAFGPSLVNFRGQPHLVFDFLGRIAMQPIDIANAQLTGPLYQPTILVDHNPLGSVAYHATPITDPNGEILGVFHSELWGSAFFHHAAFDLDPATPSVRMNGMPANSLNSGFLGGRVLGVDPLGSYHAFAIDSVWLAGGRAPVGATMPVRMFTPPTSGPQNYVSLFAAGSAYLQPGVSLPPFQGLLGIVPTGWFGAWAVHDNRNGEAVVSLVVPNAPALSGVSVPVQALTWEVTTGALYLSNTAAITAD